MKLGVTGVNFGQRVNINFDVIKQAEAMGFDSVWTGEAYGEDAISTAAWILAHTTSIKVGTSAMQMHTRTPSLAAMTAMTLTDLSNGRFIVGLGASGPQVIEGWHGVPYGKPVKRLKEYVKIMKKIFAREEPLSFEGDIFQIPYLGEGATGIGKPLKSMLHPRSKIPIISASFTPAGVAAAAEVCDGFNPAWMDPEQYSVFEKPINKGLARSDKKSVRDLMISPVVDVVMGEDVEQCMIPIREKMALYIGGMGARNKNFYNDYTKALGYEEDAIKIQDLYLSGKKKEAAAAVPADLIDACQLVGPASRIKERLSRWKSVGAQGHIYSMVLATQQVEALEVIASEVL